jgi:alpha-L-rhamnosidase
MLSDLRQLVRNTYDSNLMSIQSDCPHREHLGYRGDALGCGETGMSIYDFSAFYRKWVLDYNDAQRLSASGKLVGFNETSPFVGIQTAGLGPETGPIGWETFQPEAQLWLYFTSTMVT